MEITARNTDNSVENVNDLVLREEDDMYLCLRNVGALTTEITGGLKKITQEGNTFSIELETNAVYNDLTEVTVEGDEITMEIEEGGVGATETVTGTIERAYERSEEDPENTNKEQQADMI